MKNFLIIVGAVLLCTVAVVAVAQAAGAGDLEFVPLQEWHEFSGITGIVVGISETEDGFDIRIGSGDGEEIVFVTNQDSFIFPAISELELGTMVTGFYFTDAPTIGGYPIILLTADQNVLLSRVDEITDSVLSVGNFSISISEVELMFQNGDIFEGEASELSNRALAIYYSEGVVEKVVILFERAIHPIHILTEEELAGMELAESETAPSSGPFQLSMEDLQLFWDSMFDKTVQIIVDGNAIEAPTPFVNRTNGMVMLPVAAIAEALGHSVVGTGADVVINRGITFTVGVDSYFFGRMAPIQLFAPPELHEGILFVPISFFHDILPHAAWLADGNVIINTENIITN
ncbi:MAG: copper amine oxidase N-terminal domain-containing protein [Turicibacter sp.]|nr:copper amine oxidase N-terminal domain-containing protein [Turicibacter sp.]